MRLSDGTHLTYCTNVHPGETWEDTRAVLARAVPAVRALAGPDAPFGVGLRLSAAAAEALSAPDARAELKTLLARFDGYLFTLNGFPYGAFHGRPVKEHVYAPDWREPERLHYTIRLADLLADLMPESVDGSISTVPGGFKPLLGPEDDELIADNLLRAAAHLVDLERRNGRRIILALEPEPCCRLETCAETVRFFERQLFSPAAEARLATLAGIGRPAAAAALRRHLGVCLDLCHAAIEFEDPDDCLDRLAAAGIPIAKVQISNALRVPHPDAAVEARLRPFDDGVYLHQVIENGAHDLRRWVDLPAALPRLVEAGVSEWRVHVHVPLFLDDIDETLSTTQAFARAVLARHRQVPVTTHLEVETYTWSLLPTALRGADLSYDLACELAWVRGELDR